MTTNAKDEKRPPPQNRPNEFRRAILEMLRSFAESGSKICIPITINVAGCFVAGEMISYSDYVKLTFRVPNNTDEADWADKVDSREKGSYGKPWPRLFCPMLCGTGLNHCYRPRPITAKADGPASKIAQR